MNFASGWELAYLQTFYREPAGFAVEPIFIPAVFTTPYLRIHIASATALPTWRIAGEIVQLIPGSHAADFEAQSIVVPMNAIKLLLFPEIISEYSLKFYPKYWIDSFELQVDAFPVV